MLYEESYDSLTEACGRSVPYLHASFLYLSSYEVEPIDTKYKIIVEELENLGFAQNNKRACAITYIGVKIALVEAEKSFWGKNIRRCDVLLYHASIIVTLSRHDHLSVVQDHKLVCLFILPAEVISSLQSKKLELGLGDDLCHLLTAQSREQWQSHEVLV